MKLRNAVWTRFKLEPRDTRAAAAGFVVVASVADAVTITRRTGSAVVMADVHAAKEAIDRGQELLLQRAVHDKKVTSRESSKQEPKMVASLDKYSNAWATVGFAHCGNPYLFVSRPLCQVRRKSEL
jgi:hypothetical protein